MRFKCSADPALIIEGEGLGVDASGDCVVDLLCALVVGTVAVDFTDEMVDLLCMVLQLLATAFSMFAVGEETVTSRSMLKQPSRVAIISS